MDSRITVEIERSLRRETLDLAPNDGTDAKNLSRSSYGENAVFAYGDTLNELQYLENPPAKSEGQSKESVKIRRLLLTRQVSSSDNQIVFIGANPSYARSFEGSTQGRERRSDPTAKRLWQFYTRFIAGGDSEESEFFKRIVDEYGEIGRLSIINLATQRTSKQAEVVDKNSPVYQECLKNQKCRKDPSCLCYFIDSEIEIFNYIARLVFTEQYTNHIVAMWGRTGSYGWKVPLIRYVRPRLKLLGDSVWRVGDKYDTQAEPTHPRFWKDFAQIIEFEG
ncbi:hypothetical protein I6E29_04185 [Arcanobacterium haemolyticum]|nr:hypothetical protein [Arcanobacterium haemolyticum]